MRTETQSMFMNAMILHFNQPQPNADALIRRTLADVDPNLTVMDLRTFGNQVAGNFTQERLIAQLSSLFGILALDPRNGWSLRRDVVLRCPPHRRNRNSHGSRSNPLKRRRHGHARRPLANSHRPRCSAFPHPSTPAI